MMRRADLVLVAALVGCTPPLSVPSALVDGSSVLDAVFTGDVFVTDGAVAADRGTEDASVGDTSSVCGPLGAACGPDGGCVQIATDTSNCGACGTVCALPNVSDPGCAMGFCVVIECAPNYSDCDGVAANGCETRLGSDTNCASCGDNCELQHQTCCDECSGRSYCD